MARKRDASEQLQSDNMCKRRMLALWGDNTFADAVVICEGQEWRVHRAHLAVASVVFKKMLTSGMVEAREHRIEIKDCTANAVGSLLEFVYTCQTPWQKKEKRANGKANEVTGEKPGEEKEEEKVDDGNHDEETSEEDSEEEHEDLRLDSEESEDEEEKYSDLEVGVLRSRCQDLQLATSGAKSVLIDRLLKHRVQEVEKREEQKRAKDQLFVRKLDGVMELGEVAARYMISDLALFCAKRISRILTRKHHKLKDSSGPCLVRLLRLVKSLGVPADKMVAAMDENDSQFGFLNAIYDNLSAKDFIEIAFAL